MTGLAYAHHGAGVLSWLAHVVVWAVVTRLIWKLPLGVALLAGLAATWYLLRRRPRVDPAHPPRRWIR